MKRVGIDLGTTNSVIAVDGTVVQLHDKHGSSSVLPSAIAFPPSGTMLIGAEARSRRAIDPRNTILSAKRLISEGPEAYPTRQYAQQHAVKLERGSQDEVLFHTRGGRMSSAQVATIVARELLHRARLDEGPISGVVTVPASFDRVKRDATLNAVRAAGIMPTVRLIEEPVATALAYMDRSNLRYSAVYDLGGGTFDLAILDCSTRPFRVIGQSGDPYLGGDDIDRALAEWVASRVLEEHGWDLRSHDETWGRLLDRCERAKIRLSIADDTHLQIREHVDPAAPPHVPDVRIDRERLWSLARPFVTRTFNLCDEALAAAGLKARDIDAVFLAGGSTGMPGLRQYLARYFDKNPRCDVDPMHVVAVGASLAAARPALAGVLGDQTPYGS